MVLPLDGKDILVAGGLGFIGSNLAIKAVNSGANVTVIDAKIPKTGANQHNIEEIKDKVNLITKDVRDKEAIESAVKGKDFLFNFVGQTGHALSMNNPVLDLEANCTAHLSILEACRKINDAIKIINASTRQLYGTQEKLPISEEAKLNPPDINAIHKIASENYYELYSKVYGMKTASLRLTNTFGPRQPMNIDAGFIARFIREILQKGEILLPADAEIIRDINYVDDVNDAFLLMASSSTGKGIFNLGNTELLSIHNFAKLLVEANAGGKLIEQDNKEKPSIRVGDSYLNFSKIKEAIGWEPKINLKEGIKRTLDFYKINKEHYF